MKANDYLNAVEACALEIAFVELFDARDFGEVLFVMLLSVAVIRILDSLLLDEDI